jgi:hypothetical protein
MDWIESKSVWLLSREFTEVFVGCEAFEGLESSGGVASLVEVSPRCASWRRVEGDDGAGFAEQNLYQVDSHVGEFGVAVFPTAACRPR